LAITHFINFALKTTPIPNPNPNPADAGIPEIREEGKVGSMMELSNLVI